MHQSLHRYDSSTLRMSILAGLARARTHGTRSGLPIGRPPISHTTRTAIRDAYLSGAGSYRSLARTFGVAVKTVRKCVVGDEP